jgi:predicted ABC-type exoprotein transport system permease subunit
VSLKEASLRTFKVSKLSIGFTYFIMAAFILVVLFMSPIIYTSEDDSGGKVFFFFWSIVVFLIVFMYLRMPISVELSENSEIMIFNSLFSKKEIQTEKIIKVATTPINSAFITFKHETGKFTLLNRIDSLHELLNEIKNVNPKLETRGC